MQRNRPHSRTFPTLCTLVALCCLSWVMPSLAQTHIAIPDTAFEQKLISLGFDRDVTVNGQISVADAQAVTTLLATNAGITDLTGIKGFTNLQTLNCSDNPLVAIDINGMPSLQSFNCSGSNTLSHLNADSLPVLSSLVVQEALFDTLILRGNPMLRTVGLGTSLVEWIDLHDCPMLRNLSIVYCPIRRLDMTQLPSTIEYLDVTNTALDTIDVQLPSLELCYLNNNNLRTIDLSASPIVDWLACQNNPLVRLQLAPNLPMRTLSCEYTLLDSLDVSNNPSLQNLSCYNSQLVYLNVDQCHGLINLYAENNQLTTLELRQMPLLHQVDCGNNNLRQLTLEGLNALNTLQADSNALIQLDASGIGSLRLLELQGNQLNFIRLKGARAWVPPPVRPSIYFENNPANVSVCVDHFSQDWQYFHTNGYQLSADCGEENFYGIARIDANGDCLPQASELPTQRTFVRATSPNDTLLAAVDFDGYHRLSLDTGSYQLELISNLPYRAVCFPFSSLRVDSIQQVDTVELGAVQTSALCPYMEVGLSAPFLRATGGGSAYTLYYCNRGTAPAFGAYVDVRIDARLQVLNTSMPILVQQGNRYRFAIGTVLPDSCGQIDLQVMAQPNTTPGTVLCSEAQIYPDSLCQTGWTGPIISAQGDCQGDTVMFKLKNTGGPMTQPERYNIFEDQVMLRTAPYNLGAGDSVVIPQPVSTGKSYRIEAVQPTGVPLYIAPPLVHHTEVGCGVLGGGSFTGPYLSFYNDYTQPWRTQDCQAMIAAYDPNDKTPQPLGYDSAHYVQQGIPLSFRIRFQNTGNDTAFHVEVLDTLSTALDWTTLQITGSSHDYQWSLAPSGALRMLFEDIKLVDSTTNEPLSHGYFTYTIQPRSNLPLGTRIENQAAIYFDYNQPIFTNTTWHTIGRDFYTHVSPLGGLAEPSIHVKLFPHPMTHATTFYVEGAPSTDLRVDVHDVLGRRVATAHTSHSQTLTLERGRLLAGAYTYTLYSGGNRLASGNLLVQ